MRKKIEDGVWYTLTIRLGSVLLLDTHKYEAGQLVWRRDSNLPSKTDPVFDGWLCRVKLSDDYASADLKAHEPTSAFMPLGENLWEIPRLYCNYLQVTHHKHWPYEVLDEYRTDRLLHWWEPVKFWAYQKASSFFPWTTSKSSIPWFTSKGQAVVVALSILTFLTSSFFLELC